MPQLKIPLSSFSRETTCPSKEDAAVSHHAQFMKYQTVCVLLCEGVELWKTEFVAQSSC